LAVKVSFTYRTLTGRKVTALVLPIAGLKV